MAFRHLLANCLLLPLFLTLSSAVFSAAASVKLKPTLVIPVNCSAIIRTCNASLYHINNNTTKEQVASLYSVSPSKIRPITHNNQQDSLISVPCSCRNIFGTIGYFYDTAYTVKPADTFFDVSTKLYSGQALYVEQEMSNFVPGAKFPIHLPCGCILSNSQIVVTYTVQDHDTLPDIATLLSAKIEDIENMNKNLIQNPSFIVVGWVLFVPSEMSGL